MKIQNLLPVLAAVIGFAVAWVVKPSEPAPALTAGEGAGQTSQAGPRTRPRIDRDDQATKRPEEVNASDFPLADQAEAGPKTRTEAKMSRLSEALGLSIDQQAKIAAAVEHARNNASDQIPVIDDFAIRGNELLDTLAKILTPEQMEEFEAIRVRERDNLIEARAQDRITKAIREIDLSPGQRDELLARLKQFERAQIQEIPAAATLLLGTSILPTEMTDLTMDGLLTLTRMAEAPAHPDNVQAAHQELIRRQRELLEDELQCFDGILTPGQMNQYFAMLSERKDIMDHIERNTLRPSHTGGPDETDPEKLYGKPAPDPRSEDGEDPMEEETYEPEDDMEEDAAGNPVGP